MWIPGLRILPPFMDWFWVGFIRFCNKKSMPFFSNCLEVPSFQTFGILDGILAGEKHASEHNFFPASIKTELLQQAISKFNLLNLLGAPCQE